jgi:hypothetical protein
VKILFPTFGTLTVRFPVIQWQKEFLKSVYGLDSQTEVRPFNTMADQSTNQNSTASLAPTTAINQSSRPKSSGRLVYIPGDVEAGMDDI